MVKDDEKFIAHFNALKDMIENNEDMEFLEEMAEDLNMLKNKANCRVIELRERRR